MSYAKLRTGIDAWIDQANPTTNRGASVALSLDATASNQKQGCLFFGKPFPAGATIQQALLHVYQSGAWNDTITAKRLTSAWTELGVTWNSAPTNNATNSASQAAAGTDGSETIIDVTAMMQDISAGNAFYGFLLSIAGAAVKKLNSAEAADPTKRPFLEVTWSVAPQKPTDLRPISNHIVSSSRPRLLWTFQDPDGDSQAGAQVQLATDSAFASVVWDSGQIGVTDAELDLALNLLTKNQSDIETDATGWAATTNCVIAQDATQFYQGTKSLKMTASSAADMVASTTPATVGVTAGKSYAGQARFRPGATARTVRVEIRWQDVAHALISTTSGTGVVDSLGAWTQATVVGVAPANAVEAIVRAYVVAPANAEVHFVDGAQLEQSDASSAFRPGFDALADATSRYWRVQTKDTSGLWSGYSDGAQFTYSSPGVLALTSPGATVSETGPPLTHTFTGRTQEQTDYWLYQSDGAGGWTEIWHRGRQVSTATTINLPTGLLTSLAASNYKLRQRTWDTLDRENLPGGTDYVQVEQTFALVEDAAPAKVLTISATPGSSNVVVQWTRAAQPDYWGVKIDGIYIYDRIPGAEPFVSGTTYQKTLYNVKPGTAHTFEVVAIVNTAGVYKHSTANPTDNQTHSPTSCYLIDSAGNTVELKNQQTPPDLDIGESGAWYYPVGRRDPVRIADAFRGYEGSVVGTITTLSDKRQLENWKGNTPDTVYRFVLSDLNIGVLLGDIRIMPVPAPVGSRAWQATIEIAQQTDFTFTVKK